MPHALADFSALRRAATLAPPVGPGRQLCALLSGTLDDALRPLLASSAGDVALVALGGYGRSQLCLHSDVDLMLLHRAGANAGLVEAVFYPLWDAGLKVGHSVRTPSEALEAAAQKLETLTSLLDMRLVAGDPTLTEELQRGLARYCRDRLLSLERELFDAETARRRREPFQLLECNLKDGRGGLRTMHRLDWWFKAEALASGRVGAMDVPAPLPLEESLELLLASRNALHAAAGRAQDTWLFDLREVACTWLGEPGDSWSSRLYLAQRDIERVADAAWERVVPSRRQSTSHGRYGNGSAVVRQPDAGAALSAAHEVTTAGPSVSVLAAAAAVAAAGRTRLDDALVSSVMAASGPRWNAADRSGLLALLRAGEAGCRVLGDLDRLGWLQRALPEWRHVRAAPQHTPLHLHPVDVHLQRTVIEALSLAEGGSGDIWCADVAAGLDSIDELLLAALLHDIGKGWPGDHAVTGAAAAMAFCRRAGFEPSFTFSVGVAVRHHLLLPLVATRRDLLDDAVQEEVADLAGNVRNLKLLALLSVADARATGPTAWSPWKSSLVRTLYLHVFDLLERRRGASPLSPARADLREHVLQSAAREGLSSAEVVRHIDGMAPGYLQLFGAQDVLRHARVMAPPPQAGSVHIDVRAEGIVFDVVLALTDRPGLIALVAGVLALNNLSVLSARFLTRDDGVALQSIQVADMLANPVDDARWQQVEAGIGAALQGKLAFEDRLAEKRRAYRRPGERSDVDVRLVRDASRRFSVLEIRTGDRVGLLHAIAHALFRLGIDIHLAKVDTNGRDVVDTFYVRTLEGLPLTPRDDPDNVRRAVQAALDVA